MFVEFSLYNINTNLLAVFSFLFEFPVSERAQSSMDLLVITLWPITGLDLQLLLVVTAAATTTLTWHCQIPTWSHSNQMVCFSDRAPRTGLVLPGAGDDGRAQRRFWLFALSLEPLGHLQAGSGSLCVWTPLKPLHHGHAALGTVPERPPGRLHRLLPSG